MINNLSDIKHVFYIHLEHRLDRKIHVTRQLELIGLNNVAQRFNAIKMENGAIGCSMSHLTLLKNAVANRLDHILIVEDDIQFLDPELFKSQINTFLETHNNEWDVILLAGNNMPPFQKIDSTCVKVAQCQTTTGYLVNGHYIQKLLDNVKTGLTNLLHTPKQHALYAVDKYWFNLQKIDRWFLIIPLTVVQREDYSDIEKRVINYKNVMTDLSKEELLKRMNAYNLQKQKQQQDYYEKMTKFREKNGAF
jgi:GR25 family glycosyltransferase involved in LPS biosynthesis